MPQLAQSTLDAFRSADEKTQRQALSRMSVEAKQALLGQLKLLNVESILGGPPKPPMLSAVDAGRESSPLGIAGAQARDIALGALEGIGVDLQSPIIGTAKNIASIAPAFMSIASRPSDPGPLIEAGKAVASGLTEGPKKMMEGGSSGDYSQFAEGLGQTLPAFLGVAKGGKITKTKVQSSAAGQGIARRAIQSILKPDKSISLMEADPVGEVMKLAPSRSVKEIRNKIGKAMDESESKLQAALDQRRQLAEAEGLPMGIDVAPVLQARVGQIIESALANGEQNIARSLRQFMNARLKHIQKKYGSTYLTPDEILAERRFMKDEINFKTQEVLQQNKNAARLGVYRGFDDVLDQLVPDSAEINKAYSGQIVADKLLEAKLLQMGNADIVSGQGIIANVKKAMGEAPWKTGTARALRKPESPKGPPKPFEFHQPPRKDPYAPPTGSKSSVKLGPNRGVDLQPGIQISDPYAPPVGSKPSVKLGPAKSVEAPLRPGESAPTLPMESYKLSGAQDVTGSPSGLGYDLFRSKNPSRPPTSAKPQIITDTFGNRYEVYFDPVSNKQIMKKLP